MARAMVMRVRPLGRCLRSRRNEGRVFRAGLWAGPETYSKWAYFSPGSLWRSLGIKLFGHSRRILFTGIRGGRKRRGEMVPPSVP
jgi:hypothetical protein